MEKFIFSISLIFAFLGTTIVEASSLKCSYKVPTSGCSGQARLSKVTVELDGKSFSYVEKKEACYYELTSEWAGKSSEITSGSAKTRLELQSKARRLQKLGEQSSWQPDSTLYLLELEADMRSGKIKKKGARTSFSLECQ